MIYEDFKTKYNGKGIDFDGSYGYQCMDLVEQYNKEVVLAPRLGGNAADVWDNYPQAYYDRIPNSPTAVPSRGDIVIWNRNVGGGFGHIAVFDSGNTNTFTSFDQNWPTGSVCHLQGHDYNNVEGWLHSKTAQAPNTDALTECLRQHNELVTQCDQKDQTIKNLNSTIDTNSHTVTDLQNQVSTLTLQVTNKQTEIDSLQPLADKMLDAIHERDQALADRKNLLDAQENQNKIIGQLRLSSYKTASTGTLINELLTRIADTITRKKS